MFLNLVSSDFVFPELKSKTQTKATVTVSQSKSERVLQSATGWPRKTWMLRVGLNIIIQFWSELSNEKAKKGVGARGCEGVRSRESPAAGHAVLLNI
jgi:hypothetical protein